MSQSNPVSANNSRWTADGFLLATSVMWGLNILVFKHATLSLDAWVFNAVRLIFATVTLGILVQIESRYFPQPVKPIPWRQVLPFSFVSGFLYLIVFVKAISLTTAGNTALILSSMPMWTAVISYFLVRERLPSVTWWGLLVTFLGTVLVTTQSSAKVSFFESEYLVGNLLMLCAALAWACGTVMSKPILNSLSPLRLAFISALLTTPLHLCIVAPRFPETWSIVRRWDVLLEIIYSGIFSTGLAYASWHAGVRRLGGSHAAVYQNVVTLVAVIGGWLLLRERIMLAQLVGGLLIVIGLVAMRRGRNIAFSKQ